MKWVKRIGWVIAGLLLLGVVAVAFVPQPTPVETASVERGEMVVAVIEEGETRVRERYTIYAPLTAHLMRPTFKAGDAVEAGMAVCELVPLEPPLLDARERTRAEAALDAALAAKDLAVAERDAAQADFDYAASELKRLRGLEDVDVTLTQLDKAVATERAAQKRLDAAEAGVTMSAHEVTIAEAVLQRFEQAIDNASTNGGLDGGQVVIDHLPLSSPVGGRILRVLHESAGTVAAGTPLFEIGDPADLEVVVDVLSADATRIQEGAPVILDKWGHTGEAPLRGRVRVIEPSAFTKVSALGIEEQRVNVVVDLLEDERVGLLGDGYRVEAHIIVWQSTDVLFVPSTVLYRHDGDWSAFTIDATGKAVRHTVRIGQRNGTHTQVVDGLTEGDVVIDSPPSAVTDGTAVVPRGMSAAGH